MTRWPLPLLILVSLLFLGQLTAALSSASPQVAFSAETASGGTVDEQEDPGVAELGPNAGSLVVHRRRNDDRTPPPKPPGDEISHVPVGQAAQLVS